MRPYISYLLPLSIAMERGLGGEVSHARHASLPRTALR